MTYPATVRRIVGPTILLFSGSYFDFEAPETSNFTIEDVAHGLSMICRFAGQCGRFYSVAQHSVHLSEIVPPQDAYQGLMHDAPEAFVGDMAKPLKVMLPEYSVIEKRVEAAVFERFKVAVPLPSTIKEADVLMLVTEQHHLMKNRDDWEYCRGRTPLDMELPSWSPGQAKSRFLKRYYALAPAERGDA